MPVPLLSTDHSVVRELERKMGFEPTTFSLARRRSTPEPLPLAVQHAR